MSDIETRAIREAGDAEAALSTRPPHRYRMPDGDPVELEQIPADPQSHRRNIEPWLSAMFQSEHLSLLLGRGFTLGVGSACGLKLSDTAPFAFPEGLSARILEAARDSALRLGRGEPNFEDEIRSASELVAGLSVLGDRERADAVHRALGEGLDALLTKILEAEGHIARAHTGPSPAFPDALGSFLMSFASRSASRERLHVFTTNYDRVVEFGCELVGLRILDRFVGTLSPIFRASRLELDLHYNPPGIRGEPRFLEGVLHFTKLHGSVDWRFADRRVRRSGLTFGAIRPNSELDAERGIAAVIYPNASKDVETSAFPYSELFRDFSAAVCRPNSVLVTYGYGFGDSHINATIDDMLTIPSTHLVIISYDEAAGRITRFIDGARHAAQISFLLGSHFGDLATLVGNYLPKPAIDRITEKRARLVQERGATARAVREGDPDSDESDAGTRAG